MIDTGDAASVACLAAPVTVVSWWRGENDYTDAFGANPGFTGGAASFGTGEIGKGFSLTGAAGSFVEAANSPTLSITGPMTMDAWINATTLGGRILDKITASATDGYLLDTYQGKLRLDVGGDVVSSTASLPTGALTHVAGVYDGQNLIVYINGVQAGTKATAVTAVPISAQPLHIGADSTGANLFTGIIDEPRIFKGALSSTAIQAIYAAGMQARCGCAAASASIVSWWRGDNDFSDVFATNNGANAGAAAFAAGEVGAGFNLSGAANSYVQVPDSPTLAITGALTMDAWINASALGGRIIDKITASSSNGFLLDTYSGNLRLDVGGDTISSTATLTTGTWTHVAGVYDGANLTVYINGAQAATKTTSVTAAPTNTVPLRIGADSTGASRFSGIIDEARIYKSALTAADIMAIYQAGATARCGCASPLPGIVSWWRGDGDFADTIGANPGTSAGSVAFAAGEVGSGFSLSGAANSYVQVADAASIDITTTITVEAWINATALGGRIVDKITAGGTNGYYLDTYQNKLRFGIGGANVSSTATLPMGQFVHVVGVYDGANIVVYVNGASAGSTALTGAIPANTLPLRIGADSTGASRFNGIIDEVRVYGRALSAGEVQSVLQSGATARCK
jgi:hypothetical protein